MAILRAVPPAPTAAVSPLAGYGILLGGQTIGKGRNVILSTLHKSLKEKVPVLRRCFSGATLRPICCSSATGDYPLLADARVIYGVAPAMGHNRESHPESHFRVPAIVDALEKMELDSKSRVNEVFQLQSVKPASLEDIMLVHTKSYVTGLEKAMDKASEQGLIYIEGSGPTYATSTTFQESLVAAGVGIALVDAVVMSRSSTWMLPRSRRIHQQVLP
ncbi:hypothetical protein MLD38_009359 [Melastoma candidum]|uniref:Uncharacterized protein n=1 Tax=Melastoma candidum TaxID=119954 RepID=A0ACB9RZ77_9MYRT|nr:hypothetical protein MLD38_009359 [Melastoma candidum]